MSAVKCLMLGGPADGRRILVDSQWSDYEKAYVPLKHVTVEAIPEIALSRWEPAAVITEAIPYERFCYERQPLREADQQFWVYTLTGSGDSIFATLLSGYKHEGAPQVRQPLTDDWIRERCDKTWVFETVKQWVRAVEQEHDIKGSAV